jgi:hypothetical protein
MLDIVPSQEKHDWTFTATSEGQGTEGVISWENSSLGSNSATLMLHDVTDGVFLDMKKNSTYPLDLIRSHTIKIYFSVDGAISPDISGIGRPYPNPFTSQISIPIITSQPQEEVNLAVYDALGRQVRLLAKTTVEPGLHEIVWDGNDDQSKRLGEGIYLYRFYSSADQQVKSGKIILK